MTARIPYLAALAAPARPASASARANVLEPPRPLFAGSSYLPPLGPADDAGRPEPRAARPPTDDRRAGPGELVPAEPGRGPETAPQPLTPREPADPAYLQIQPVPLEQSTVERAMEQRAPVGRAPVERATVERDAEPHRDGTVPTGTAPPTGAALPMAPAGPSGPGPMAGVGAGSHHPGPEDLWGAPVALPPAPAPARDAPSGRHLPPGPTATGAAPVAGERRPDRAGPQRGDDAIVVLLPPAPGAQPEPSGAAPGARREWTRARVSIGVIEITVVAPPTPPSPAPPVPNAAARPRSRPAGPAGGGAAADRLRSGMRRWHGTAQG